jgi:hypothetical protein
VDDAGAVGARWRDGCSRRGSRLRPLQTDCRGGDGSRRDGDGWRRGADGWCCVGDGRRRGGRRCPLGHGRGRDRRRRGCGRRGGLRLERQRRGRRCDRGRRVGDGRRRRGYGYGRRCRRGRRGVGRRRRRDRCDGSSGSSGGKRNGHGICRVRGRRRGRRRRRARGQESERVDVALCVGRPADAELDVRVIPATSIGERADRIAFGHGRVLLHRQLTQMRERHRPAVRRLDRDRPAAAGHGACERDAPGCRRPHGRGRRAGNVDAAMLPGRIRVAGVEGEWRDDAPVGGPGPRVGAGNERKHGEQDEQESTHEHTSWSGGNVCSSTVRAGVLGCQKRLQSCHREAR